MLHHFRVTITPRSVNKKTGPILVTTSPRTTCPDVCALRNNGCYADIGPIRRLWDRLTGTAAGETFPHGATGQILVHGIDSIVMWIKRQHKALWRHNQAGDLFADERGFIDEESLLAIVHANKEASARGFTYTHHNVLGNSPQAIHNRRLIKYANDNGFTINLSANNDNHAAKLRALNIGPVCTLARHDDTADNDNARTCPALLDEHVTCYNCGLCALANRGFDIKFPAHGKSVKKADAIAA